MQDWVSRAWRSASVSSKAASGFRQSLGVDRNSWQRFRCENSGWLGRQFLCAPRLKRLSSRLLFFLLHRLRRVFLSLLDPLRKCGWIHERMRVTRLTRFQLQAAFEHSAAALSVITRPAINLHVHPHTFY